MSTGYIDYAGNLAYQILNDTTKFVGILGASDTTVQQALEKLSIYASTVTAILQCDTSDDFCFVYDSNVLALWVNGSKMSQWPDVAVEYTLLLDDGVSGYKLLLDDGAGGYFLVIK